MKRDGYYEQNDMKADFIFLRETNTEHMVYIDTAAGCLYVHEKDLHWDTQASKVSCKNSFTLPKNDLE